MALRPQTVNMAASGVSTALVYPRETHMGPLDGLLGGIVQAMDVLRPRASLVCIDARDDGFAPMCGASALEQIG